MGSGFPRYIRTSAHDSGQVLTFEGQTCSLGRAFTTNVVARRPLPYAKVFTHILIYAMRIPVAYVGMPHLVANFRQDDQSCCYSFQ